MAAKETTLTGSVVVETVATGFNVNRIPVAGTPPTVALSVGVGYADHSYLVDAKGEKTKLLQTNEAPKYFNLTPQETGEFYSIPVTSPAFPGVSTLGDLLAAALDARIALDLAKTPAGV